MRKLIFGLFLAVLLLLSASLGTSAEDAEWDLCGANGNTFRVYYTININSLQVESFTVVNTSGQTGYMRIKEDGVVIFEMLVPTDTIETKPISGFKFKRVPATDHDDPNSIRYPASVQIGCRWPAF